MTSIAVSLPTLLSGIRSVREFGVILVLAAVVVAVMTLWEKWKKYRTRNWPTATGTITKLDASKVDGGLNGIDYWKVAVHYAYGAQQEHSGVYTFNCATEQMSQGAVAGLTEKPVCVHYSPSNESKSLLWEDEIWDLWWDTYWRMANGDAEPVTG